MTLVHSRLACVDFSEEFGIELLLFIFQWRNLEFRTAPELIPGHKDRYSWKTWFELGPACLQDFTQSSTPVTSHLSLGYLFCIIRDWVPVTDPLEILQEHQLCTWTKIATDLAAPLGLNDWLLGANPSLGHLRMSWERRGHCLKKFSQWKPGAIERKTKGILIPTPGDIIPPPFLPKGIQKGDSFKAFLMISLDHRHGVFNFHGSKQHGHYTFIRKITSLHFTLSGNFMSKTKRVSNSNKQLKRRKRVTATPQRNFLMVKPVSKPDCRLRKPLACPTEWLILFVSFVQSSW